MLIARTPSFSINKFILIFHNFFKEQLINVLFKNLVKEFIKKLQKGKKEPC
jgi:hypothetical protein